MQLTADTAAARLGPLFPHSCGAAVRLSGDGESPRRPCDGRGVGRGALFR